MFFFIYFCQVIIHTIRLPKQSTVGDVLDDLKTKVKFLSFDSLIYLRTQPYGHKSQMHTSIMCGFFCS